MNHKVHADFFTHGQTRPAVTRETVLLDHMMRRAWAQRMARGN